jgi:hypothetical protein
MMGNDRVILVCPLECVWCAYGVRIGVHMVCVWCAHWSAFGVHTRAFKWRAHRGAKSSIFGEKNRHSFLKLSLISELDRTHSDSHYARIGGGDYWGE